MHRTIAYCRYEQKHDGPNYDGTVPTIGLFDHQRQHASTEAELPLEIASNEQQIESAMSLLQNFEGWLGERMQDPLHASILHENSLSHKLTDLIKQACNQQLDNILSPSKPLSPPKLRSEKIRAKRPIPFAGASMDPEPDGKRIKRTI